jgi:transposase
MAKQATPVELSAEDQRTLRAWIKDAAQFQLRAQRARIILLAAERRSTKQIARVLGVRAARVSKWRTRFAAAGLAGLEDVAKPGKPRQYDESVDRRILALVEQPPPAGAPVWTGRLLAQAIENVSLHYIWKVLRQKGVKLRRRDRLEVEIRSPIRTRLATIIALYLGGSTCAFLIATCEGATIPSPPRGFVRAASPDAAADLRLSARAKALTLSDALQWALSRAEDGLYTGRSARSLDAFLSDARSRLPSGEIHVFLLGSALQPHPGLHIFAIPTVAAFKEHLRSWLFPLCNGAGSPSVDLVSRLVSLAERLVAAQMASPQAAFEWHAPVLRAGSSETPHEGAF